MQINLSLSEAFFEAFGYQTTAFDPKFKDAPGNIKNRRVDAGKHGSPYYGPDKDGREYYLPIEVQVGTNVIPGQNRTYAEALGVTDDAGAITGRWHLPYPVISIAEMTPLVIDTELTERSGLVSQLINLSGYKITVRGFLFNKNNEFPEDDFDTLNRLAGLKVPFRINNPITDIILLPISSDKLVTIRSLRFMERPGVKHVKPYELTLMTEVPFNLEDIS